MEHADALKTERNKLIVQYNSLYTEYMNLSGHSQSNPGQVMERRHLDKMLRKTHERIHEIDEQLKTKKE
jgi:hypothetical protein